jgi:oxygen-independent coproporphyrinogen-3 oxidase
MAPGVSGATPVMEQHEVGREDRVFEFMMNALRLTEGFSTRTFLERTGIPVMRIQDRLDEAERRGLITRDQMRIAPTLAGRRFLNDLLQIFLPDPKKGTDGSS